jgi:hypothetical protein
MFSMMPARPRAPRPNTPSAALNTSRRGTVPAWPVTGTLRMSVRVATAVVPAGAWLSTGAQSCASRCGAACCAAAGALLAGVAGAFQLVGALGSTSRISCADTGPTAANKAAAAARFSIDFNMAKPPHALAAKFSACEPCQSMNRR